ncbi:MAG: precorrin-8X methylmutase [Cloacibacillus evryensis]
MRPALVIGVPVGFVNVVESKERLLAAKVPISQPWAQGWLACRLHDREALLYGIEWGLREGYSTVPRGGGGEGAAMRARAALPRKRGITTPEEGNLPRRSSRRLLRRDQDAGDDPDSTDGILIKAAVELSPEPGR